MKPLCVRLSVSKEDDCSARPGIKQNCLSQCASGESTIVNKRTSAQVGNFTSEFYLISECKLGTKE